MSKLVVAVAVLYALAGCTTTTLRSLQSPPLAPGISFNDIKRYTQSVGISRNGQEYRLLCILELNRSGLVLVAFTELGQRLFTVVYGPNRLGIDRSPVLPASFDARLVLADLQLVYWPLNTLQHSLNSGWSITESEPDNGRRLLHDGELVAAVQRDADGTIEIQRPLLGYRMTIDATSN